MTGRPDWRGLRWLTASLTVEERFWIKVSGGDVGDCWLWTAAIGQNGYGNYGPRPRVFVNAHRWAWEHLRGPVPDGLYLDHLCRNRACVNPWHLEPVTQKVNMERGYYATLTHCKHGHEYDAANTMRNRGKRSCRTCHNDRRREPARASKASAA